ncbi:short-chain dehydrogenase [Coniophora puteana RWD-64-598 SS2]|uniref:Short-chain dehydrogenase n=1 Tax=Coniophora puteana (strain RWD-64-598) TaxID=741705 RepID=A0A5M3M6N6_CONPW|nr:short-chain dehydrogenase [Coniophora puteana RWD-64-598 SS2]EIW75008.1 short-chain dehydrogenase [Coniophora puteana RWD-64-598 SS2]
MDVPADRDGGPVLTLTTSNLRLLTTVIMKLSFFDFIVDQWSRVPSVVRADLSGQTVVVVGANVGIGLEASVHFASMNPERLIIACRSESKGKDAVKEITRRSGYANTELWIIDLSSFASVSEFADRFERETGSLDMLVMNAALATRKYEVTKDGWESTLQVNYLSTTLLPLLLFPRMVEAGKKHGRPARLVTVASDSHYWSSISRDVQASPTPLRMLSSREYCTPENFRSRYPQSKLLNILHIRALAEHLRPLSLVPVTPVMPNPGFCYSQLRREIISSWRVWFMEKLIAWPAEYGARQLVFAALGVRDDEEGMRGAYVSRGTKKEESDWVISEEGGKTQALVWEETMEILKGVDPRVGKVLGEYMID